ncbi:MAG: T9SS type A sorting domain-containing protein [Bacteroidetes bacterium]|nr:T9SS type A sorting domain-containing protein [Bacteroidota bacterium]
MYFVGVHEVDSTLTLGTTTQLVTPQTVWVSWNTIPPPAVNGWASADDFNFFITYNLRMNFGTPTAINEIETNSTLIALYPSPASSEINIRLDETVKNAHIEIYNSVGSLVKTLTNVNEIVKVDVSGFAKGIYSVMVTANGKSFTQRFSVAK